MLFIMIYVIVQLDMEDGDSIDVFQQQTGGSVRTWKNITRNMKNVGNFG